MTAWQLYYTSSRRGRDGRTGGPGFQVNAATDGMPRWAEDLAIRSSSYEPPAQLLGDPGPGDLEGFPVSLGFSRNTLGSAIFQSRYTGSDFAGRQGNYFAHAIVLDESPPGLDGLLPIDLWRAPIWVHTPTDDPGLPAPRILAAQVRPEAGLADPMATAEFLRPSHRRAGLTRLLTAVVDTLAAGNGRVILIAATDREAALWISAITRSLTRTLALVTTFSTYSARPDSVDAVIAATTPDTPRHRWLDSTVVDLTDVGPGAENAVQSSPFAIAMARLWAAGAEPVQAVHELLHPGDDALSPADLEALAPALGLLEPGHPDRHTRPDPARLLACLAVIVSLPRAATRPWPWNQLWDWVLADLPELGDPGGLDDLGAVLRTALQGRREAPAEVVPVPIDLQLDYAQAVVLRLLAAGPGRVPGECWLPALNRGEWERVAAGRLGSWPLDGPSPAGLSALDRVAGADLRAAMAGVLDRIPGTEPDLGRRLPIEAAVLLRTGAPPGTRAERILRAVVRHFTESLVELAGGPDLSAGHADLAGRLLTGPRAEAEADHVLRAVVAGFALAGVTGRLAVEDLERATRLAAGVPPGLRTWLRERVADAVLRTDSAVRHHDVLTAAFGGTDDGLLRSYTATARRLGVTIAAEPLVRWIGTWMSLTQSTFRQTLLEETLPALLTERADLQGLSRALAAPPADVLALTDRSGLERTALLDWWTDWQRQHRRPVSTWAGLRSVFRKG